MRAYMTIPGDSNYQRMVRTRLAIKRPESRNQDPFQLFDKYETNN
jgi:hypothetical protein